MAAAPTGLRLRFPGVGEKPAAGALAIPVAGVQCARKVKAAFENTSRFNIGFLSLTWIALVGVAVYWAGPQYSMMIFYLIPVTLGTWFNGRQVGMLLAACSIVSSCIGDLTSGLPHIRYWNEGMGLASYFVFVIILSGWRDLLNQLESRVEARTADLKREITERKRIEKEMSELGERERRRLGHDLHDGVCQHLTGTALSAASLCERLSNAGNSAALEAERVVTLLKGAIELTRNLSRGLFSPELEIGGLISALAELADKTAQRTGIVCEFQFEEAPLPRLPTAASSQLFRIAQEAVANAIKHAHASRIVIEVEADEAHLDLNVYDNGIGFSGERNNDGGLGLGMMQHGAELIGAKLSFRPTPLGGTTVSCALTQDLNTEERTA